MSTLVVFDLFQTLVSAEDWWPSDFVREVAAAERLGVDAIAFSSFWDGPARRRYVQAGVSNLMVQAAQIQGVAISAHQLDAALNVYGRYHDEALMRPRPEVLTGLEILRSAGCQLALLSNADEREVAGWSLSPLARLIPLACFSYSIGAQKPSSAAYATVLHRAGVSAASAVFVGDGGSSEFEGARQVGFGRVVCVTDFGSPKGLRPHTEIVKASELADETIASVADLPALLSS